MTVSGDYSVGFALNDQNGTDISADNVFVVMGGNMGLGVTPPTSSLTGLFLGNTAAFQASGNDNYIGSNFYFKSGTGWVYRTTDEANQIVFDADGSIDFKVASSGTADNAISWTTAMTIDNSGNVATPGITLGNGTTYNAANHLDDYEEGTWSPGMTSAPSSAITVTVSTSTYTKIGRLVYLNGLIRRNDSSTYNGTITLTNLPFSIGSTSSVSGSWWSDSGSDNGHKGTFLVQSGSTTVHPLHGSTPATTSRYAVADGTNAAFPNNEYFFFSITYTV